MVYLLTIVIAVAMITVTLSAIARTIYVYRGSQDEVHFARTEDGYEVALYRYRPENLVSGREPVIVCHGLGSNRFSFDPGPLPSLARYLKAKGLDVWTLDLRGRGLSSRPDRDRGGRLKWGWTFDHYVKYDLPAAIRLVRRETGYPQVNWIGHSMGGMVMYAYLQTQDVSLIKSATALGSPATFVNNKIGKPIGRLLGPLFLQRFHRLHLKPTARALALFGYFLPLGRFGTPRNLYPWFGTLAAESPSTGVLGQFHDWVTNSTFRSADHSYRYDEGFPKIKTPFMVISASGDFIASPSDVRYGIDNMTGPDRKYAFFSKKDGNLENYDHMTMLVSQSAAIEIYPVIHDWLMKHSG